MEPGLERRARHLLEKALVLIETAEGISQDHDSRCIRAAARLAALRYPVREISIDDILALAGVIPTRDSRIRCGNQLTKAMRWTRLPGKSGGGKSGRYAPLRTLDRHVTDR